MAVGEYIPYARDFFRLAYPAGWTVRENRPVGMTHFAPRGADVDPYPSGIALITLPETGMALEPLIRTGLFLITRDLSAPSIERTGEQREGGLEWSRILVRGRAMAANRVSAPLDVTKHVALARPGPGVLVLELYGPAASVGTLEETFESVRRSVETVR